MNNKTICGDVFIVPNPAVEFKNLLTSSQISLNNRLRRLIGQEVKEDDNEEKMLQIWVTSPECDDWAHFGEFQKMCGIIPGDAEDYKDNRIMGYFPKFVPARLFEGKKEGDTVHFFCKEYEVSIELTCKQLSYGYRRFGRFEKVFAQVVN